MSDTSASTSAAAPRAQIAKALGSIWWLPLLRGVLLIVIGAYALFQPAMTVATLVQVAAIFLIIDGVFAIVAGIMGEVPSRGWTIVRGLIAILVGVFVVAHPVAVAAIAGITLLYIIAIGALVGGFLEIFAAISDRKEIEGEGWLILGGVLSVIFGVLLLIAPLAFGTIIVRILGAYAIIFGVALIAFAFRLRGLGHKIADHEARSRE